MLFISIHFYTNHNDEIEIRRRLLSESELLEEEIDSGLLLLGAIGGEVSLGEDLSDLLLEGLSGLLVGELLLSNDVLKLGSLLASELSSDGESSGEDVVIIDDFDESVDLGPSIDLLVAHSLSDLLGVSFDTGNEGVGEALALLSLIEVFHNDSLLSSSSSSEEDDNSAGLHTKENNSVQDISL